MTKQERAAGDVVADALDAVEPGKRVQFLRSMACHALAGVVAILGAEKAAMMAYRIADAMVARGAPDTVRA